MLWWPKVTQRLSKIDETVVVATTFFNMIEGNGVVITVKLIFYFIEYVRPMNMFRLVVDLSYGIACWSQKSSVKDSVIPGC
jgi:hypothetical protein